MNYKKYRNKLIWDKLKSVYYNMKKRCYNSNAKSYHRYGGRGIKICPKWRLGFIYFYLDALEPLEKWLDEQDCLPTIDRIDNDGNYAPENCRWIDQDGQMLNSTTWNDKPIDDRYKDLTYKFNNYTIEEVHDHLDKFKNKQTN